MNHKVLTIVSFAVLSVFLTTTAYSEIRCVDEIGRTAIIIERRGQHFVNVLSATKKVLKQNVMVTYNPSEGPSQNDEYYGEPGNTRFAYNLFVTVSPLVGFSGSNPRLEQNQRTGSVSLNQLRHERAICTLDQ